MTNKELIKMALDALEDVTDGAEEPHKTKEAIETLRAALTQPERAECDGGQCGIGGYCKQCPKTQLEPEPIAYLCENAVGHKYFRWKKPQSVFKPIALYTAPPQREWVGLTHKEKMEILTRSITAPSLIDVAEALLKEKNK